MNFKPERVDIRPERADFRPVSAWGRQMGGMTNGMMNESPPVFYRLLPKREDFRLEITYFRSGRADFRPEKPD